MYIKIYQKTTSSYILIIKLSEIIVLLNWVIKNGITNDITQQESQFNNVS